MFSPLLEVEVLVAFQKKKADSAGPCLSVLLTGSAKLLGFCSLHADIRRDKGALNEICAEVHGFLWDSFGA